MKKFIMSGLCCIMVVSLCGCDLLRDTLIDEAFGIYRVAERMGLFDTPEDEEWAGERYYIYRLNSSQNPERSNTEYIYRNPNGVYQYFMEEGTLNKLVESEYVEDFALYGDDIYYSEQWGKNYDNYLRKRNIKTGEETLLFECIGSRFHFNVYNDYILYGYVNFRDTYLCPVGGNLETDSINVNELYDEEDQSGKEQFVEYEGMIISRSYDLEHNYYMVNNIKAKETDKVLLYATDYYAYDDKSYALIDYHEKKVTIKRNYDAAFTSEAFQYQIEGREEWYPLTCYRNSKSTTIFGRYLTVDGENIVGMIQEGNVHYIVPLDYQRDLDKELLFQLNPKTGASEIIFETEDEHTRIIGYESGTVYLFEDYTIYRQSLNSEEREALFTIPIVEGYIFDWQGDYLIVRYDEYKQDYGVAAAYKIK